MTKAKESPRASEFFIAVLSLFLSLIALAISCKAERRTDKSERASGQNFVVDYLDQAAVGLIGPTAEFFEPLRPQTAREVKQAKINLDKARNLLRIYPNKRQESQLLGLEAICSLRRGSIEPARKVLEYAERKDLTGPETWFAFAILQHTLYYDAGKTKDAERLSEAAMKGYQEAAMLDESGEFSPRSQYHLGLLKMDREDYEAAIPHLESAKLYYEFVPYYYFQLGAAYFSAEYSQANRQRAIDYSTRAIELQPHYPSAYFHRGYARFEIAGEDCTRKSLEEALSDLIKALEQYKVERRAADVASTAKDITRVKETLSSCPK
jgi:tetratricopeptide (TPR) repeat protein